MRNWKRLFYYLMINVFVSACTVLTVLTLWDQYHPQNSLLDQFPMINQATQPIAPSTSPALETLDPATTSLPTETAVLTPSELLLPESPTQEIEYTIQEGDTLGDIAVKFEISVVEIMSRNDITDPDRLEIGTVIIIPIPGAVEPTETAVPTQNDTPPPATNTPLSPTPTQPSGETRVIIESVVGVGDLATERVLLLRTGPGELSLAGWKLQSEDDKIFVFPQLVLYQAGAVNLYTKTGAPTVVALYWGLDQPVWHSGDTVTLIDNLGLVHATYNIP